MALLCTRSMCPAQRYLEDAIAVALKHIASDSTSDPMLSFACYVNAYFAARAETPIERMSGSLPARSINFVGQQQWETKRHNGFWNRRGACLRVLAYIGPAEGRSARGSVLAWWHVCLCTQRALRLCLCFSCCSEARVFRA